MSTSLEGPGRLKPPDHSARDLSLLAWATLLLFIVLPFSAIILRSHRPPDGDFAGFYSLGVILNHYPMADLYNYPLLVEICNQVHPRATTYGPLPYPPFVGLFFQVFTLLPFWAAYLAWIIISLALYAAGLHMIISRFFPLPFHLRSLLFCLAFAYAPFLIDTAANGQLAAVGFFALAVVICEDDAGRLFASGLALSLCTYKPTLLVLILPMLLVTRRFRTILGFIAGALALASIPTLVGGFSIWRAFLRSILNYGKSSTSPQVALVHLPVKSVDLSALFSIAPGGRSIPAMILFAFIVVAALGSLAFFGWRSPRLGKPFNSLLWAAAITWTLLLNLYVPIYDSILAVISLILTAAALRQLPAHAASSKWNRRVFTFLWLAILFFSWFTIAIASRTGIQPLTLLLTALGAFQFLLLREFRHLPLQPPSLWNSRPRPEMLL